MAFTTTQNFLEIDKIKDGILILKNSGLRGILMVSSLNFALKSEDEQNATLFQFQDFLNSLDFSCQIVIQSRRLNITGYLEKLKGLERNQDNELLKIQTSEYRLFISRLIETGAILTKTFFVVVPYAISESLEAEARKNPLSMTKVTTITEEDFQRCKSQLWQRMEFIAMGLKRCGLSAVPLTTPEIVELFWSLHHPKDAEVGYYPEFPSDLVI